jgi:hypothetical protein
MRSQLRNEALIVPIFCDAVFASAAKAASIFRSRKTVPNN